MPPRVSLQLVVDTIALGGEGWTNYLNRDTGEIIPVSDEMEQLARNPVEPEALPEWQVRLLPQVREVLHSASCIPLPDWRKLHERDTMGQFAYRQGDLGLRNELLASIRSPFPRRAFHSILYERDLEDSWREFQLAAVRRIATNWLEMHGVACD